jgi:hypothetical protein
MSAQIERALQQEVMTRLRAGAYPVLAMSIPNGVFLPAHSKEEREIAARIISQMKASGQLVPGAPDLAVFFRGGHGALIELKRPASRDLLGNRIPAGRPSQEQRHFAERAADLGVHHAFCTSWDEVRARLAEWGAI